MAATKKKPINRPVPAARIAGKKGIPVPDTDLEVHRRYMRKPGMRSVDVAIQPGIEAPRMRGLTANGRALARPVNPFYYAIGQGAETRQAITSPLSKFSTAQPLFEMWAPEYWDNYASMNRYWAEYRKNWLVRACINQLAYWSTKNGFDVVLEPADPDQFDTDEEIATYLEQFDGLKAYIDHANQNVDMDNLLKQTIIQAKVIGRMGYEIETTRGGEITRLVPLRAAMLLPVISPDWQLAGYSYRWQGFSVQNPYFEPDEILYFANNDVDGSFKGISEIEPILKEIQLEDKVVREDLTEAATTLWAGIAHWGLDLDRLKPGTTEDQVDAIISAFVAMLKPGVSIASDNRWTPTVVDAHADINALLNISDKMLARILGNFQVPRFMVGLEQQGGRTALNRATAYAQLEAFVQGPISDIQRWLGREVERQWYNRLARQWLLRNKKIPNPEAPLLVLVKHKWHEIRTTDWFELVNAVAGAYSNGLGFIDQKKAYEMMGEGIETSFDPQDLAEQQNQIEPTAAPAIPSGTQAPGETPPIPGTPKTPTPPPPKPKEGY